MGNGDESPFGIRLRGWRTRRGLSQLALAELAGSTARHISFLETGRSRPSRPMALRLATALDVRLREANQLLHAAGLPAAYPKATLGSSELMPYRAAVQRMLAAHEPYPGLVLDAHFTVVLANQASSRLFGRDLAGVNFVRDALLNPSAMTAIDNWAEVAWSGLDRLRRHLDRYPLDAHLRYLVTSAEQALHDVPRPTGDPDVLAGPTFQIDGQLIRTLAMVARFDQVADVTLDELPIELMYPADETAERFFAEHAH